jgi:molecular chaperone GrpE
MVELLKKEGVEPIEAEGLEFNPELHEAMMRDTSGEHPENIIIQEFEKGYTFDGRVIRPSKVKVSSEE